MSPNPTPASPPPGAGSERRRSLAPVIATIAVVVIGVLAFVVVRGSAGSAVTPAAPTVTVTAAPSLGSPPGPSPSASTSARTSGSSRPTSASPSPTSTLAGATATLPVYYVAEVAPAIGPRLYREFRQLTVLPTGKVATAVQAMISLPPSDPDYSTLWPASALVRSVSVAAAVATVDLTAYPSSLGAAHEATALTQLIYTVTAADPAITGVRVRVNGAVPSSGHLDLSGVQRRGKALDEQANVWILAPTQGLTTGSPVTVKVYGTGFEGNVPLKVFRAGTEVASTRVTTMMGGFAEAQTTITLPPGSYEIRAYNDNGRDETLQVWDTKMFTIS